MDCPQWSREIDISNYTIAQIKEIIKENPTLIGRTSTMKQFFEDDCEYEYVSKEFIGKPVIDDEEICGWDNVKIIDSTGKEEYLVHPDIHRTASYSVNLLGRLTRC